MFVFRFSLYTLALLVPIQLTAQVNAPVRTDSAMLRQPMQPFAPPSAPVAPVLGGTVIRALQATLEDGHLKVRYGLNRQELGDLRYRVSVRLRIGDTGAFFEPEAALLRGNWGAVSPSDDNTFTLSVLDVVEQYQYFDTVAVQLLVQSFGTLPFDCAKPPKFGLKQSLPLIGGAASGVIVSGIGLLMKTRSNDQYDRYKSDASAADAEQLYQDANSNHKTGITLMEAGGVVVLAAVGYHVIQKIRFKHKQRKFREYCRGNAPALAPQLGLSSTGTGLKLKFIF